MKTTIRWGLLSAGVLLILLGLGCLNYTKARGLEHHTQFAIEHGLPQPSETILFCGSVSLMGGGALIGYLAGSRRG
jgi:hypothetical protein